MSIVTIGLARSNEALDREALASIANDSGGVALWASDAEQLPVVFGGLRSLLDDSRSIIEATFQVSSPVENAFRSGRPLLGTVSLKRCPWDCYYAGILVVVRIP